MSSVLVVLKWAAKFPCGLGVLRSTTSEAADCAGRGLVSESSLHCWCVYVQINLLLTPGLSIQSSIGLFRFLQVVFARMRGFWVVR